MATLDGGVDCPDCSDAHDVLRARSFCIRKGHGPSVEDELLSMQAAARLEERACVRAETIEECLTVLRQMRTIEEWSYERHALAALEEAERRIASAPPKERP